MARMRRRDIHAISFCVVSIAAALVLTSLIFDNWLYGVVATSAFSAWLLTRARMIRVFRRLRGETTGGWGDYYRE